ncbi:hypothetical protein ENUP19_0009G0033 [Entamoeba nuttalli]|uniref:TLDc domain-containing protein n=2 Tax=Entamoeba nuttalli TaxID=412467 RepID=K2GPL0_ENTNP|nr:hypothetical protein ENU1_214820 [Entamoeba nuttalli P19]EKE36893.1 hypothetical protein ENU1_214820 [Entamoeba nuttalli P19]|eukprot:XP_008860758.1 hypothetical protein ENU1_214820 [Entamoeba nuttalli P19]
MTSTQLNLIPTEHLLKENEIFGYGKELLEATGFSSFNVVYDSKINGFNKSNFNASVIGKQNILTLIITNDNYIFGAYHSNIPSLSSFQVAIDSKAFIFALSNGLKIFKNIDSGSFFNGNQPIYEVSCAFKINDPTKQSIICAYAHRYYQGLNNSTVFAGNDTFITSQLIALELH